MTNHLLTRSTSTYSHTQNLPFPSTSSSPSTTPRTKFLLILFTIAMATLFSISFLSLILSTSLSSATNHLHHRPSPNLHSNSPPPEIHRSCKATRYPATCTAHLSKHSANLPQNPTPTDIIQSTLSVSAQNLKTAQSMVQDILSTSSSNLNRSRAAQLCLEGFTNSARRTSDADLALSRGRLKDARAWTSAALSYQYDCWSGLGYVNGTSVVNQTMSFIDTQLLVSTSNALSMMLALDAFGNDSGSWVPLKTERDGFWPPSGSGGLERRNIGGDAFWKGLLVNVTVCKDGCDYKTVQAAVDRGIPVGSGGGRFVVHIKAGIYKEIVRIGFEHRNLVFIGDGMGKTVITGSLKAGIMGISTYSTAIVGVLGDGFMAYGLTFENTAGPPTSQAVAFRSDSDLSYIENCEFLGNQDTLYAHSLRQLYKSCRIEGNVDFIFGNSAAVFLECTILVRPRQLKPEKGEKNAITAQGRTDPAQSTGFSFLNCVVNGTEEYMKLYHSKPSVHKNFLGRPWKEYSRTVFIRCNFEEIVNPKGWFPFRPGFALKTLYYGEYGNVGPGAGLDQRVPWSSSIPPEHVGVYYIDNFIQGDEFSIPGSFSLQ